MDIKKIKQMAEYCLNCKNKNCKKGCPLENNIPDFINYLKDEKWQQAYDVLCNTTVLPAICGRVCPHEKNCESYCIRGTKDKPVQISTLESFVGDMAINGKVKNNIHIKIKNKKIAVVGGGPSGLTCACFLAKEGYKVTIYEKRELLGGILSYGIPEFRLKPEIVKKNIKLILDLGIEVKNNCEFGKQVSLNELKENYDAVFLALGANVSTKMHIEGENLEGVFGANLLLSEGKHPSYKSRKVCVIGGGNVAMDIARYAKKEGAGEVKIIYRRGEEDSPANRKEIQMAKNEGIEFLFKTNIIKIIGNKKVKKIECVKTKLIKMKEVKRLVPANIENSNFEMETDYVIMAIGSRPETTEILKSGIKLDEKGYIQVDEEYKTNINGVFAGGDLIGRKAIISNASRIGRDAANSIIKYVTQM